MKLLIWNQTFSVNHPVLDQQHQTIISLINSLYDILHGDQPTHLLPKLLDQLAEYTQTHFEAEESLLESLAYPHLQSHRALHRWMSFKTSAIRAALAQNGAKSLSLDVLDFLKKWWFGHIQGQDKQYASLFQVHSLE
ncbi:MAG: bacteriohemerythrin [candidate division FCPU426 bacterium]